MKPWLAELQRINANLEALIDVLRDLRAMWAEMAGWEVKK